ncbi:Hypothetical predicted protein [Mytilus galloprovincialis]|uniref:Reverse transcriptase domain-containing protein n=1 Tax=Mytilus galloprovincialis TaxID=29158 RepID=A0A8B6C488_MYTGA|nr:Hypothetical predicted protein [Mytilus galloprovincialis]
MFEGDKRRKNTLYEPCTVQPMDGSNFTPPERTSQEKDQKVQKKLSFEPEERFGRENSARQSEMHAKRTFDGTTQDVWSDFLRYYENFATLNGWSDERKRMLFLTTLRGQAETYVHGLPNSDVINWNSLLQKMELRFWPSNMKESYLVEEEEVEKTKLNDKTIKDAYPIPRIEDNIDALSGAKWMSVLDLSMAYHQVPMNPTDKENTAFSTPRGGFYQYVTTPFGLCNAGATFQRIIETAMRGLQWHVLVLNLDDIIVFSETFDEHLVNLQKVFQRKYVQNKDFCKQCNLPWDYVYNNSSDNSDSLNTIDQQWETQHSQIISTIDENENEDLDSEDLPKRRGPKRNAPSKAKGLKKPVIDLSPV